MEKRNINDDKVAIKNVRYKIKNIFRRLKNHRPEMKHKLELISRTPITTVEMKNVLVTISNPYRIKPMAQK
jgi:hypothetical protein